VRRREERGVAARRLTWGLAALLALGVLTLAVVRTPSDGPSEHADARHPASVFGESRVGPRLLDLNVRSPALGTTAMVRLMTPVGWSRTGPSRRWPVLYLLHGCCDAYESWTRSTDLERLARLREVLVVMPEGGPVGFYSNWVGSRGRPGPGWETFHLDELRAILERDYGAGTRRAVAGLSMGGQGAIGYAARRPGLFRAAASFSGLLHPLRDADFHLGLFAAFTPDPLAIWGDPDRDRRTWARHDPTELAERLGGTRLFVSAGNGRPGPYDSRADGRDRIEVTALGESRAFVRRARRFGIPVRADFYGDGRHAWPYWERELRRALPTLLGRGRSARRQSIGTRRPPAKSVAPRR
jgi:diacylglycerol O-acyltransferase/trehalose O-mycolyltransferase